MLKRLLFGFFVLALFLGPVAAKASTVVLTFDDLTGEGPMPSGYGGFNWASNMGYWDTPQDPYNPESGATRVLFNISGQTGYGESLVSWISGSGVFDGAYFDGESDAYVYINLYFDGNLVATTPTLYMTNVPTFLSSGYSGQVDAVGIYGDMGYFAMDNFTYETSASTIPEPASFLLLGTGLGVIGLASWRMRR